MIFLLFFAGAAIFIGGTIVLYAVIPIFLLGLLGFVFIFCVRKFSGLPVNQTQIDEDFLVEVDKASLADPIYVTYYFFLEDKK